MRRNSLGVRWGLGVTGAGVRREMKSPGTTSEERLRAEARGRCRSCTSEPAIPCVVTRDGLEFYARGYRSSTSFGSMAGTGLPQSDELYPPLIGQTLDVVRL
jgi:hypothetical protein